MTAEEDLVSQNVLFVGIITILHTVLLFIINLLYYITSKLLFVFWPVLFIHIALHIQADIH